MWIGIFCRADAVPGYGRMLRGNGEALSRPRKFIYLRRTIVTESRQRWEYARLAKFVIGSASHLYYWIYPGVMFAVMGILCGYLAGTIWPSS